MEKRAMNANGFGTAGGSAVPVPGLERLDAGDLRGARVGLVAHPASVARDGRHALGMLSEAGVRPCALFGPEHGFAGTAVAGERVGEGSLGGFPVHSLYGENRAPRPEWLEDLDVVLFDLQSVACRAYTYGSTLRLTMEACAAAGKALWVLDRADPLMGVAPDGPMPLKAWMSFVGMLPVPFCHGLTLGELALYLKDALPLPGLDLRVVEAGNLSREAVRTNPGSVFPRERWRAPSPALKSPECAWAFPLTVFFEAFPFVDVGRGGAEAFRVVRAPGSVLPEVAGALCDALPGVRVSPVPPDGIRFEIADFAAYRPAEAARILLRELDRRTPLLSTPGARPEWLNKLWGTPMPDVPCSAFNPRLLY